MFDHITDLEEMKKIRRAAGLRLNEIVDQRGTHFVITRRFISDFYSGRTAMFHKGLVQYAETPPDKWYTKWGVEDKAFGYVDAETAQGHLDRVGRHCNDEFVVYEILEVPRVS